MNTYTYKIDNMFFDEFGIVNLVAFTVTATNDIDSIQIQSNTQLSPPTTPVIPYSELTEDLVISWVKDLVGLSIEAQADFALIRIMESKRDNAGVPW